MRKYDQSAAVQTSAVLRLFSMLIVKRCPETGLLDIYLTTSLAVPNFGNT